MGNPPPLPMIDNEELAQLFYIDESEIHGQGLYARIDIEQGAYMGTYDGPEVEDNSSHVLWAEEGEGEWVGRDGQNMLRYLNHSDLPLAEFKGFDLYAINKINPGAEITIDYGEEPD